MLKEGKSNPNFDGSRFLLFRSEASRGEGRSGISQQLASGSYRNFKHSHSNKNTSPLWSFLPWQALAFP